MQREVYAENKSRRGWDKGSVFDEGFKAYSLFCEHDNPYEPETLDNFEWLRGFRAARSQGAGLWYN
jgi:hypothetical protein